MSEITQLNIYPVKSLRGIAVEKAILDVRGLQYDRNWMITDDEYHFITQRQIPLMATITVRLTHEHLILERKDHEPLYVDLAIKERRTVSTKIWKDHCEAIDEGEHAAEWLKAVLQTKRYPSFRLVRFSAEFKRPVEAQYLQGENAHTAFPDGYPFLITVEESLDSLNRQLKINGAESVPMGRFRPNIVVSGLEPFVEDRINELKHESGNYVLGLRKPCQRCKIITIDQDTGAIPNSKEPLHTLTTMNRHPGKKGAFFGQNATLLDCSGETISVGDRLTAKQQ